MEVNVYTTSMKEASPNRNDYCRLIRGVEGLHSLLMVALSPDLCSVPGSWPIPYRREMLVFPLPYLLMLWYLWVGAKKCLTPPIRRMGAPRPLFEVVVRNEVVVRHA